MRDAQEPLRFVVACDIFFHMDSFCDAFMTFLHLLSFSYLDFQWRERNIPGFIKITFNLCFEFLCVWNNIGGEEMMTIFNDKVHF